MNKMYVWLLACLIYTLSLGATGETTLETITKDDVAHQIETVKKILANEKSIKDRMFEFYERMKQFIQELRSNPQQDPKALRKELLQLWSQKQIKLGDLLYLQQNEALLENFFAKSSIILTKSIDNLSRAHAENNTSTKSSKVMSSLSMKVAQEIIKHLSGLIAAMTKLISHENKALVDTIHTHINDLKKDEVKKIDDLKNEFKIAFQKALEAVFNEQELEKLCKFLTSPVFTKLLNNAQLLEKLFIQHLSSPDTISKLKSLI